VLESCVICGAPRQLPWYVCSQCFRIIRTQQFDELPFPVEPPAQMPPPSPAVIDMSDLQRRAEAAYEVWAAKNEENNRQLQAKSLDKSDGTCDDAPHHD
jgi:hypothetical protein